MFHTDRTRGTSRRGLLAAVLALAVTPLALHAQVVLSRAGVQVGHVPDGVTTSVDAYPVPSIGTHHSLSQADILFRRFASESRFEGRPLNERRCKSLDPAGGCYYSDPAFPTSPGYRNPYLLPDQPGAAPRPAIAPAPGSTGQVRLANKY